MKPSVIIKSDLFSIFKSHTGPHKDHYLICTYSQEVDTLLYLLKESLGEEDNIYNVYMKKDLIIVLNYFKSTGMKLSLETEMWMAKNSRK